MICGFERALRSQNYSSPWCDLITGEESKVLEYTFDLKVCQSLSYISMSSSVLLKSGHIIRI